MKKMRYISMMLFLLILLAALGADENSAEVVVIETDLGRIVIDLFEESAPLHSKNMKKLAREGFYDSTSFHRVVPGFVIQGGDPFSKDSISGNEGRGGPGYTIPAEIGKPHVRGAIGAARLGDAVNPERQSNGSQFYICLDDLPHLDEMGYTIFGQVIEGMDVADQIAAMPVKGQSPVQPVLMKKVYVTNREKEN